MKPFFTNSVLVQMSEQEIVDVRTAISNQVYMYECIGEEFRPEDYYRFKKLREDLDFMISKGLPF